MPACAGKTDVRVEKNDTVGFVHRRCGEQELYFFSNISREAVRTALTFYQVSGGFRVLCAESGRELPVQGCGGTRRPAIRHSSV